jgi:fructose-specific phosphotransferase system IIC component
VDVLFFWAIPSWIVGLALSSRFRPAVSLGGMMAAFFATVIAAHLFSFRELFTSVEGLGAIIAEIVAGLILTGVGQTGTNTHRFARVLAGNSES